MKHYHTNIPANTNFKTGSSCQTFSPAAKIVCIKVTGCSENKEILQYFRGKFVKKNSQSDDVCKELLHDELGNSGLDIGYVPAGSHAFLRLSGQFGPLQLIWANGFFFFFLVLRMPPLFLLGIGKTRKATLIRTYFCVIDRPNVQKCATSRVKS